MYFKKCLTFYLERVLSLSKIFFVLSNFLQSACMHACVCVCWGMGGDSGVGWGQRQCYFVRLRSFVVFWIWFHHFNKQRLLLHLASISEQWLSTDLHYSYSFQFSLILRLPQKAFWQANASIHFPFVFIIRRFDIWTVWLPVKELFRMQRTGLLTPSN